MIRLVRGRLQALVDDPRLAAAAVPVGAVALFVVKGGGFESTTFYPVALLLLGLVGRGRDQPAARRVCAVARGPRGDRLLRGLHGLVLRVDRLERRPGDRVGRGEPHDALPGALHRLRPAAVAPPDVRRAARPALAVDRRQRPLGAGAGRQAAQPGSVLPARAVRRVVRLPERRGRVLPDGVLAARRRRVAARDLTGVPRGRDGRRVDAAVPRAARPVARVARRIPRDPDRVPAARPAPRAHARRAGAAARSLLLVFRGDSSTSTRRSATGASSCRSSRELATRSSSPARPASSAGSRSPPPTCSCSSRGCAVLPPRRCSRPRRPSQPPDSLRARSSSATRSLGSTTHGRRSSIRWSSPPTLLVLLRRRRRQPLRLLAGCVDRVQGSSGRRGRRRQLSARLPARPAELRRAALPAQLRAPAPVGDRRRRRRAVPRVRRVRRRRAATAAALPADRRALAGGAVTVVVYWVIHDSIDWFWEIPAAGGLRGPRAGGGRVLPQSAARASGEPAGGARGGVAGRRGGRRRGSCRDHARPGSPPRTSRARRAGGGRTRSSPSHGSTRLDGSIRSRASPTWSRARSRSGSARTAARRGCSAAALTRQPRDWYAHLELAALATDRRAWGVAQRELDAARRLNPLEYTLRIVERSHRGPRSAEAEPSSIRSFSTGSSADDQDQRPELRPSPID